MLCWRSLGRLQEGKAFVFLLPMKYKGEHPATVWDAGRGEEVTPFSGRNKKIPAAVKAGELFLPVLHDYCSSLVLE